MIELETHLLEIADGHDRRASRLSDRENIADERQAAIAIRSALLTIATLRAERDSFRDALKRICFLDHNEREWASLEEAQSYARTALVIAKPPTAP